TKNGVDVMPRLHVSESCPLILPHHVALDHAREKARGKAAIGTTGRGIGPAYEDKVSRRGLRVGDLMDSKTFGEKLKGVMEYHNFALKNYFHCDTVDYQKTLDECQRLGERLRPLVADIPELLHQYGRENQRVMFEGAQGTLLDIDHGTYPFVTSSNTCSGAATTGSGVGPSRLDYVLGITKAYTTRVGAGPFPTELHDEVGDFLGTRGHEFGATTGRKRRCGWFDAVIMRRSNQLNGITGLCITKLDVLDGLDTIRVCTAYRYESKTRSTPPSGADALAKCEPIYEDLPGWKETTLGVRSFDKLPANAQKYLKKIEEFTEARIDIISTGAERDDTIILRHPFA
ncbi:MAG: adenylosuccinate synthase, partial [Gammaproteobacteria bacterium]|nr:adenylosuccinate synthase [Gammaproteobacteria bacterium]